MPLKRVERPWRTHGVMPVGGGPFGERHRSHWPGQLTFVAPAGAVAVAGGVTAHAR
ncbi:MAG: hypothetical protein M3141_00150 [Actinomycetota bacterium]|nr:hypothetical protein [Actinomycetota bacterium]